MTFLVLSPPVHQPSEPPAGAFLLSAALEARGVRAPFFDLSLEFFHYSLEHSGMNTLPALDYMMRPPGGLYGTHRHASCSGVISSALRRYARGYPGWRITPMDCTPPDGSHDPRLITSGSTPFSAFLVERLEPVLDRFPKAVVLVSVAYLSQLPAAVELSSFLAGRNRRALFGGSLFESLSRTGTGLEHIRDVIPCLTTDDGRQLIEGMKENVLDDMAYPELLSEKPYLSPAPVIPLAFTTGCVWNRCLFCPDRGKPLIAVPLRAQLKLLEKAPSGAMIHFIDSTIPAARLPELLPALKGGNHRFFGFARATSEFLADGFIPDLAAGGCAMLQWGIESGSRRILERFRKGIQPETAMRVMSVAAEHRIRNYAYFLFGLPGETDGDREMTLDLVEKAGDSIHFLNASVFNLPIDSELARRSGEFGMTLGTYDPEGEAIRLYCPFVCGGADPRAEAKRFIRNRFSRNPAVSRLLTATPNWFRASHMAFMET